MKGNLRRHLRDGEPFVWATALAVALILMIAALLLAVVMFNGLSVFWPADLVQLRLQDGSLHLGRVTQKAAATPTTPARLQLKIANRDLNGLDFRWFDVPVVADTAYPADALVLERREYGDFHGYLTGLQVADQAVLAAEWGAFAAAWERVQRDAKGLRPLQKAISVHNRHLEQVRLRLARLRYEKVPDQDPRVTVLLQNQTRLKAAFEQTVASQGAAVAALRQHAAVFRDVAGKQKAIPLIDILRFHRPNQMNLAAKSWLYACKLGELLFAEPREANTEGGLFPAIIGTVMMVFIMSVFSFPLGVITGVYLREYARDGWLVRTVRIAVNNLAGIPSIVYGIFGLGFFIYLVGGNIDRLFFPERLPAPTFGTGGILWASLTLALLTVPVVIVSTEEALGAIPQGVREGSLALGATKLQTLLRVLLPMASPGIMTGFILAMARAAGEVAPLMITGVVKLAPALPLDGSFPFIHMERKFMHLGFHIYDIGFQSPNVEAAKPMVFVTTLLLVFIVLVMSSVAIHLRNRMKKKYTITSF